MNRLIILKSIHGSGFCRPISASGGSRVAAIIVFCQWGRHPPLSPLVEHNSAAGGINPSINTNCVDGGIEQFSFLQPQKITLMYGLLYDLSLVSAVGGFLFWWQPIPLTSAVTGAGSKIKLPVHVLFVEYASSQDRKQFETSLEGSRTTTALFSVKR